MIELQHKILIVDDAPINIQILNEALKESYRVFFATSGKDAIRLAASAVPDMILLDIMMPDMDGFEVCRVLKGDPVTREIPVIFITAMNQQENETIGLELGAADYITKPFNPDIVRLRVRNHLELKSQRDLLERLSFQDGLTGIQNRRAFDERYEREWRRAFRNRSEISIIMCDIDYFKAFNDSYGHLAGDDCLRKVAILFDSMLERPADIVARYGGEEFICLLPETDYPGAFSIAEKLRESVASMGIAHGYSPVSTTLTVSLGVATMIPQERTMPDHLISKADKQLYLAKQGGRNRVSGEPG
jgi:diguanylate cyclase (GGDEF)-like protein